MANTARNKPGTAAKVNEDDGSKALENIQQSYETNKKTINTVVTVVLVVVIGFFAYKQFYKAPRENKAASSVVFAIKYFEKDSVSQALDGDGQHKGFKQIMKSYDGTSTANMCHYYAGVCYLKLGKYADAVKQLEDFDGKGTVIENIANGSLGDAYLEMGKTDKAIDAFKKAIDAKEDLASTPYYLLHLAKAYEIKNNADEAKKTYKRIRDEYPTSQQAQNIEKDLARLGDVD